MSITFDSVALVNPEEHEMETVVKTNEVTLISGKNSVQTSTATFIKVTFKCLTETYTDVSNLRGKAGSKATLSINGTSYTNCAITGFRECQIYPNVWEYEVSFTQDTS